MVSLEAFSELLQVLYSAPLQQEQWQRFLTLLCQHTDCKNGFFLSADTCNGLAVLAEGGMKSDGTTSSIYNQAHAHKDPFRAAMLRLARTIDPVGVFTDEDLLPNDGLLATDVYREVFAPAELRHASFLVLAFTLSRLDVASIWRTPEKGPLNSDSIQLLQLLIPHIQTALQIRRSFGVAQQKLAGAKVMADASGTATFLITREGRLMHWNVAAESLVRNGDGLALVNNHLVASYIQSTQRLRNFFINSASGAYAYSASPSGHSFSLERPSGKPNLQLLVCSMPDPQRASTGADLLLMVTDPEAPVKFPDELLRTIYEFTPVETEVANGLLMGYTTDEIANLRRVSVGTVRQQLKKMMEKTATARQSDMVRLFMTLPRTHAQTI
jgi:DNA-binding CsgD family transcriptional regulator